VLPVQVSPDFLSKLFQEINENPNSEIKVDLPNQSISILNIDLVESFEINNYKKQNMLNGFDDIDYLINIKSEIEDFAKKSII
jgi:3-isopropylmalate/(R)-2-methylmalate dehydratase small subunit